MNRQTNLAIMKQLAIAKHIKDVLPVKLSTKDVTGKHDRVISAEKINTISKEKQIIAPYYDELHFGNYE